MYFESSKCTEKLWAPNPPSHFTNMRPRIDIFLRIFSQKIRTSPYLGPSDVFSETFTYDCSFALNKEVSEEKSHLLSKMAAIEQFFWKTAQVGQKRHFFAFFVGGLPFLGKA